MPRHGFHPGDTLGVKARDSQVLKSNSRSDPALLCPTDPNLQRNARCLPSSWNHTESFHVDSQLHRGRQLVSRMPPVRTVQEAFQPRTPPLGPRPVTSFKILAAGNGRYPCAADTQSPREYEKLRVNTPLSPQPAMNLRPSLNLPMHTRNSPIAHELALTLAPRLRGCTPRLSQTARLSEPSRSSNRPAAVLPRPSTSRITGVPHSPYNPTCNNRWEPHIALLQPDHVTARLQKRPGWYSNMFGSCKVLMRGTGT